MNRAHFLRCCLAMAGAALVFPAAAEEFPSRPIRIIVPFATGGISDMVARLMGQEMGKTLGQSVIVESRPGAGANIGGAAVARASADGYTLLMGAVNNFAINQYVFAEMPYDPFGFTPITLAVDTPQVIVVNAKVPVQSLKELVEYAKTHQVDLGSQGIGTTTQIALGMLNQAGGVNIQHVPYKGAGAVTPAVLSGEVQVAIAGLPNVQSLIKNGSLRALAVTSPSRMPALPDVPTTAEAGFPSVVISNWFGLVAPGGLDPAVVGKLHDAAIQALKTPSVVKSIEDAGMVVVASTPAEMDREIRDSAKRFAPVIEAAGIVKQ